MRIQHLALTAVLASLLAPAAFAQSTPPDQKAPNEQVINPEIDRRDVRMPRFPSNDFEIGVFVGSYATQNFGTSVVGGLRAGYHITEDIFVEGVLAQTKVSDEDFRNILPSGIFTSPKQKLSYYNLSVGWNVLPGEVFVGSRYARLSSFAYGPREVLRYLRSLLTSRPLHYLGHNPAGSWVIYLLIVLGIAAGASGYATYNDMGGEWLEELHEGAANAMLALVLFHLAGVAVASLLHRENLVRAMVTGYKLRHRR